MLDWDLFRYRWITDYWKRTPPVHVSVAAFLGTGKDQPTRAQRPPGEPGGAAANDGEIVPPEQLASFVAMLNAG